MQTRNERKAGELAGRTYYLTGPMSGMPQSNFPAFAAACLFLRNDLGLTVVSPAELDDPEVAAFALASPTGEHAPGHTWGGFLGRDIPIVADKVTGLILMQGWEKSRGARLESYCGALCGHVFYLYPSLERVSASYVIARL